MQETESEDIIKYLELQSIYGDKALFKVSFNSTVDNIDREIKGIVNKNLTIAQLENAVGIKLDIPSLQGVDNEVFTNNEKWATFSSYNFCMVQFAQDESIDLIAIHNIDKMFKQSNEFKKNSKIVTTNREIPLYNLYIQLKMLGVGPTGKFDFGFMDEIIGRVAIKLTFDAMYFLNIRQLKNGTYTLLYSASSLIRSIMGIGHSF